MTSLEKEYKFKYSNDINEAARDCQECLYDGYYSGHIEGYQCAFKEGTEWKEQQMIDKACVAFCRVCDTKECEDYESDTCNWLKKFKQAMKGE